jgi:hypothetical protein
MLPTVVYLLEALRRALKRAGRGLYIVAEAFGEAREAARHYPFAE